MSRIGFTEEQRAFIYPLLPPPARTGRPRADDRRTTLGILYALITGCRWQDLPREYGVPTTVWRRLKRWSEEGICEHIWQATLTALDQRGDLDWSIAFLDGSFVPAKKGGEGVGLASDPRSWWPIAGMTVARFARPYAVAASGCASHPRDARRAGARSRAVRSSRAETIIGSGTPLSAASPSSGNFRRLLIRWEHLFSVYHRWFTVAVCAAPPEHTSGVLLAPCQRAP